MKFAELFENAQFKLRDLVRYNGSIVIYIGQHATNAIILLRGSGKPLVVPMADLKPLDNEAH